jgi:hypothetical protein
MLLFLIGLAIAIPALSVAAPGRPGLVTFVILRSLLSDFVAENLPLVLLC